MMKKRVIGFSLLLSLLMLVSQASAAGSPIIMLDKTAKQVISALQKNKATLHTNKSITYQIVNQYLLPHVDVYGMSRSVLGRNAWNSATKSQRVQFTKQFTKLVIRTYSGALADYTDETVKFYPIRGGYQGKKFVRVNSTIQKSGAKDIPLNYSLVLLKDQWKIYDMSVEGVSLLQSFRSQFATELSQGDMDSLIATLTQHNAKSI